MKQRLQEAQNDAITEYQNEFSVVTQSQMEHPEMTDYSPMNDDFEDNLPVPKLGAFNKMNSQRWP